MPEIKWYGWRPDTPDHRDKLYSAEVEQVDVSKLPPKVDLRPQMASKPWNQSKLGSCTGFAIAKMREFVSKKQGLEVFRPSPLFIYYNERLIEGTVREDAGAEIRDGLKVLGTKGVCPEDDWPYDIEKFARKPSSKAYANALLHRAIDYKRVLQRHDQMKGCLAAGYGFAAGFSVYSSFEGPEVANTGFVPMPLRNDVLEGGHAVFVCGYDDELSRGGVTGFYIVCNSWDTDWGDGGYFYMPYPYFENPDLASDFWTIRSEV